MVTHRWPLPADLSAARTARTLIREQLDGSALAEDAVLAASELAANAVSHGSGPIELVLQVANETIRICVVNSGVVGDPHVVAATTDASRGRGLALVEALSDAWGWEREGDRLQVWAEMNELG